MRKLMWLTIGYAGACAVGTWLLRGSWMLLPAALGLLGAAVGFWLRKYPVAAVGGMVSLGLFLGSLLFFGYERVVLVPAAAADGETMHCTARVVDFSWQTDYGSAVDAQIQLQGRTYKIRLYLSDAQELSPGDMIETDMKLRLTDEGGSREPTFHRSNGILLLGYQRGSAVITAGTPQWTDQPALWRRQIREVLQDCFPADTFGFAKALLLGDKTDLTDAQQTDFSVSGISHVVAVSGLHVSILFSLVYLVSGKRRFLTILVGLPVLVCFAALAGFTPSVIRAAVMQGLMLLALAVNREYDPPTALAFSCLAMLAVNPLVIASVGFQLSVASVAGIFLFEKPLREGFLANLPGQGKGKTFKARLVRWFAGNVSVTLSATVMTVPLVAVYFHTVSLVGVVTNLLVLFAISGIFYGIMAVCLLGMLSVPLGSAVAAVISWPIRYVLVVAHGLAGLPLAAVYTDSIYIVAWLILVYGLLLWTVFTGNRPVIALCGGAIALCMALMASWMEPLLCSYRVTALDVGQGQCLILQSGGRTFMVDCGGDHSDSAADTAARLLLSQGIRRIDGLILTHYDTDHTGGAAYLSQRIEIANLYLPGPDTEKTTADVAARSRVIVEDDLILEFNGAVLTLFAPEIGADDNERSVSVLFQREKYDTLITGDLSAAGERRLIATQSLPDLEVLIVGHHGSKYSTCAELLKITAPDVAIISAGADNHYGHPAPETLSSLQTAGCAIYRTDQHGTITYRG